MTPPAHDHDHDDELDGCDIDFQEFAVDHETASLLPLFPQGPDTPGLEQLAEGYRQLGALDA